MSECEYYQELISRMLDRDLSKRELAAVTEHLGSCQECAAMYAAFSALSKDVSDNMVEPPEELAVEVMARVRRREMIKRNKMKEKQRSRQIKSIIAAAACVVAIVAAVGGITIVKNSRRENAIYESRRSLESMGMDNNPAAASTDSMTVSTVEATPTVPAYTQPPIQFGQTVQSSSATAYVVQPVVPSFPPTPIPSSYVQYPASIPVQYPVTTPPIPTATPYQLPPEDNFTILQQPQEQQPSQGYYTVPTPEPELYSPTPEPAPVLPTPTPTYYVPEYIPIETEAPVSEYEYLTPEPQSIELDRQDPDQLMETESNTGEYELVSDPSSMQIPEEIPEQIPEQVPEQIPEQVPELIVDDYDVDAIASTTPVFDNDGNDITVQIDLTGKDTESFISSLMKFKETEEAEPDPSLYFSEIPLDSEESFTPDGDAQISDYEAPTEMPEENAWNALLPVGVNPDELEVLSYNSNGHLRRLAVRLYGDDVYLLFNREDGEPTCKVAVYSADDYRQIRDDFIAAN